MFMTMDYQEIIDKIKPELEKAINYLKEELAKIRTSRPSSSLVEWLEVDCFGKKTPLKSLGLITLGENKEIIIQPWDISYVQPICQAILKSHLQASSVVEKELIKLKLPPLSEDLRKTMVRLLSQKGEETRQRVRHWRQAAQKEVLQGFSQGEISQDDKYRAKNKLQDLVDEYNQKIEKMIEDKKAEVME